MNSSSPMPNPPSPAAPLWFRGYLFKLGLLCALLYLLPVGLTRLPAFRARLRTYDALDYGYAQQGVNADVVVTGDSSGFAGIDPHRLAAKLGKSVALLPDTYSSFTVTREAALRHYLSANRPPQLIVFYRVPWDLNYGMADSNGFEGEEMLVRHGTAREILDYLVRQPRESLLFPFNFYFNHTPSFWLRSLLPQQRPTEIERDGGHIAIFDRSLVDGCRLSQVILSADTSMAYTQTMLNRYSTSQTRAIAIVAPMPACIGSDTFANRSYAAIDAQTPLVLPPNAIVDDSYYAHPLQASVPRITDDLAGRISKALQH